MLGRRLQCQGAGVQILSLGVFALGAEDTRRTGEDLCIVGRQFQGFVRRSGGPALVTRLVQGLGHADLQLRVIRRGPQQGLVQRDGFGAVAIGQVHARQCAVGQWVVRPLGQCRGQGVVSRDQIAFLPQYVSLTHGVQKQQFVVGTLIRRGQRLALQLVQQLVNLGVIAGFEQHTGIRQAQRRGRISALRNGVAQHRQSVIRITRIDIRRGQHADGLRLAVGGQFSAAQQGQRLLTVALLGQRRRLGDQRLHLRFAGQLLHWRRALTHRDAIQRALRGRPFAQLARQQGTRVQDLGVLRVGLERIGHGLPGLVRGLGLQVIQCQVVVRPGIARIIADGFLLRRDRTLEITTARRIFGLAHRYRGFQRTQVAQTLLLGRGHALDHLHGLAGLTVLRHHGDQPEQRIRVVVVQAKGLTIAGLGIGQLVLFSLYPAQRNIAFGLTRLAGDGLLQQAARPWQVLTGPRFVGLTQQAPVAVTVQRRLPALVGTAGSGPAQQLIGVTQTALTLTHQTEAAQGVGVLRLFFEAGQKRLFSDVQLVVLQRLVAARKVGVHVGRAARFGTAEHLRADLAVVRVGLEISLKQRDVRRAWGAQPDQPLAPAFGGFTAQFRQRRQLRKALQTFRTGAFIANQQFGQY